MKNTLNGSACWDNVKFPEYSRTKKDRPQGQTNSIPFNLDLRTTLSSPSLLLWPTESGSAVPSLLPYQSNSDPIVPHIKRSAGEKQSLAILPTNFLATTTSRVTYQQLSKGQKHNQR